MSSKSRLFATGLIVCFYAIALFALFAWSLGAPMGDFWHMPSDTTVICCVTALVMHVFIYLDPSFGFNEEK